MKTGIDIVKVDRFYGQREEFYKQVFTDKEIEYARSFKINSSEHFAGFFACKEAVMKALGKGIDYIPPTDIEITHNQFGKPIINLYGRAKDTFNELFFTYIEASISHTSDIATAICIIY